MRKKEVEHFSRRIGLAKISLDLDSYNEIFSNFDPRPYSMRSLSDDFLIEAKKASIDKVSGQIELNFLVPRNKRNEREEVIIKKRLRAHFKKHYLIAKQEMSHVKKQGLAWIFVGMSIMLIATMLIVKFQESNFLTSFLITLLEPAGWFLFWEGLDMVVFEAKRKKPEFEFYEKMSKAQIYFHNPTK